MLGSFYTREQIKDVAVRRAMRRDFFRKSSGFAAGVAGGLILAACGGGGGDSNAQSSEVSDPDILNFALNLEYLEAQFYVFAATGSGLPASMLDGTGTRGEATGGRAATFADPVVRQYANEIAADEMAHVAFLRAALGGSAVAQPSIDISPAGAFTAFARSAGVVGAGATFDPYASDDNFLLAAFIFEDVGVTAYKGASPLIQNKTFLEAAAGILAVEAYHAGLIRTSLYARGVANPMLRTNADQFSDARDATDNSQDTDQGISPRPATVPGATGTESNVVPSDSNGLAISRTNGDVLNLVYLDSGPATRGGFFPAGVNGSLVMASAFA